MATFINFDVTIKIVISALLVCLSYINTPFVEATKLLLRVILLVSKSMNILRDVCFWSIIAAGNDLPILITQVSLFWKGIGQPKIRQKAGTNSLTFQFDKCDCSWAKSRISIWKEQKLILG